MTTRKRNPWLWAHAILTAVFAVQIPVALATGLKDSVPYLVFLSLWALVAGHWSAWQAVRAEMSDNGPSEGPQEPQIPVWRCRVFGHEFKRWVDWEHYVMRDWCPRCSMPRGGLKATAAEMQHRR